MPGLRCKLEALQIGAGGECPAMILLLDAKRRMTIPASLAPSAPGDAFEAIYDAAEDELVLRRVKRGKWSWMRMF